MCRIFDAASLRTGSGEMMSADTSDLQFVRLRRGGSRVGKMPTPRLMGTGYSEFTYPLASDSSRTSRRVLDVR